MQKHSSLFTIHCWLETNVIIGILDFERTSKQTVIVETKINYNYTEESFIDYSIVLNRIETLLIEKKYKLIEEALEEIGQTILGDYPQIISLYLKISKPDIIPNASVALSKEWK
ncbi:MAG TPA: FolB domain-containing protein [Campylobacterales bacterium]|nr:FolB domain-containing protein [Campylobacterales bacterium]HHC11291.1 FolB domain-containing protein [Campylobacterales bacterium]HHD80185.1 FolB domain-containing protein [Campylobacterales bacterium]